MQVRVLDTAFYVTDCALRLPFRFGAVTLTHAPLCVARIEIGSDAGPATGHAADLRYMGTLHEWTTMPPDPAFGPDRDGYASKVGLGWTYGFSEGTWLRASISHEPDPQRFGGGNVQLQLRF